MKGFCFNHIYHYDLFYRCIPLGYFPFLCTLTWVISLNVSVYIDIYATISCYKLMIKYRADWQVSVLLISWVGYVKSIWIYIYLHTTIIKPGLWPWPDSQNDLGIYLCIVHHVRQLIAGFTMFQMKSCPPLVKELLVKWWKSRIYTGLCLIYVLLNFVIRHVLAHMRQRHKWALPILLLPSLFMRLLTFHIFDICSESIRPILTKLGMHHP